MAHVLIVLFSSIENLDFSTVKGEFLKTFEFQGFRLKFYDVLIVLFSSIENLDFSTVKGVFLKTFEFQRFRLKFYDVLIVLFSSIENLDFSTVKGVFLKTFEFQRFRLKFYDNFFVNRQKLSQKFAETPLLFGWVRDLKGGGFSTEYFLKDEFKESFKWNRFARPG